MITADIQVLVLCGEQRNSVGIRQSCTICLNYLHQGEREGSSKVEFVVANKAEGKDAFA